MKWIPSYDRVTGEEYLKTPKKSVMTSNMLILVDEAGMLGHTETNLLIDEARMVGALIFFVGDHKQCYGVFKKGEEVCVPAYRASTIKITLDIPKRQTEGDYIYALSLRLRAAVDGHRLPVLQTLINPDDGKGIVHVDDIEPVMFSMFHAAKKLVDSGEDPEALFKVKVLAFTNNKCINLNRKIRREVFGVKDSVPFIGEVLMANKSVPSPLDDGDMLLKNNEYVTVKSVELDTVQGLSGFWLTFEENDNSVFSPKSIDALKSRLQVMAKEAKENNDWASYYRLKNGVADMRNIYAQTVNKAQGSTLKEVCVMMDNIDSCRDESQKRRLAYTAVSRGTHKVYVEGELT
jgi:ATP-dependent exoDNAse (exonuclease V) alpha subunit